MSEESPSTALLDAVIVAAVSFSDTCDKSAAIGRMFSLRDDMADKRAAITDTTNQQNFFARLRRSDWNDTLDAADNNARKSKVATNCPHLLEVELETKLLIIEAPYSLKYKRQVLRAVGVADCVLIFINVDKQFGITSVAKQFRKELGTLCVSLSAQTLGDKSSVFKFVLCGFNRVDNPSIFFDVYKKSIETVYKRVTHQENPFIIPIDSASGENVIDDIVVKEPLLEFYKGPSLHAHLKSLKPLNLEAENNSKSSVTRLLIVRRFVVDKKRVIAGRVANGELRCNDFLELQPDGELCVVKTIHDRSHQSVTVASRGAMITVELAEPASLQQTSKAAASNSTKAVAVAGWSDTLVRGRGTLGNSDDATGSTRQVHVELTLARGRCAVGGLVLLQCKTQRAHAYIDSILGVMTQSEDGGKSLSTTQDGQSIQFIDSPALAIICFVPLSPIFFDIDSKFGRVLVSQLGGTARLDHSRLSAVGRVLSHVDWPKGINTTPHTLRELKRRAKLDPMCKIKSPFNDEFDFYIKWNRSRAKHELPSLLNKEECEDALNSAAPFFDVVKAQRHGQAINSDNNDDDDNHDKTNSLVSSALAGLQLSTQWFWRGLVERHNVVYAIVQHSSVSPLPAFPTKQLKVRANAAKAAPQPTGDVLLARVALGDVDAAVDAAERSPITIAVLHYRQLLPQLLAMPSVSRSNVVHDLVSTFHDKYEALLDALQCAHAHGLSMSVRHQTTSDTVIHRLFEVPLPENVDDRKACTIHRVALLEFLIEADVSVTATNSKGQTALTLAIVDRDFHSVAVLLQNGIEATSKDLDTAFSAESIELVALLVVFGAPLDREDKIDKVASAGTIIYPSLNQSWERLESILKGHTARLLQPAPRVTDTIANLFRRCVKEDFNADHTITIPHEANAKISFSLSLLHLAWPTIRPITNLPPRYNAAHLRVLLDILFTGTSDSFELITKGFVADDDNKPSTVELATADTAVDYLCELTQYLFGCLEEAPAPDQPLLSSQLEKKYVPLVRAARRSGNAERLQEAAGWRAMLRVCEAVRRLGAQYAMQESRSSLAAKAKPSRHAPRLWTARALSHALVEAQSDADAVLRGAARRPASLQRSERELTHSVGLRGLMIAGSSSDDDNEVSAKGINVPPSHAPTPDLVLIAGNRRIAVHKALFAARVPFFEALFRSGMDAHQREFALEHVSSEVLRNIVTWVYTDTVKIRSDSIIDVLEAAHRMRIVGLFDQCQRILAQNLDTDNVIDILAYASMYEAQWLTSACLWFVALGSRHIPNNTLLQDLNATKSEKHIFLVEKITAALIAIGKIERKVFTKTYQSYMRFGSIGPKGDLWRCRPLPVLK